MSDANRKRKSRDKQFYIQQAKRNKLAKFSLVPGIKGFLLFCNKHEKEAIREGYRILNEFADKRTQVLEESLKEVKQEHQLSAQSQDSQSDEEIDVDQAMDEERQALARERQLPSEEKRFQVVESGAQNVLFIRTTWEDPVQLAMDVMNAILESGEQRTRYLLRLLPVEATCKSQETAIEKAIQTILPRWFKGKSEVSYAVQFKCRLNSNLNKDHITRMIGRLVRQVNDAAKVDFKKPNLTVMVEVMKGNCCIGVLPNYAHYRKYNLIELASPSPGSNKADVDSQKNGDEPAATVTSSEHAKVKSEAEEPELNKSDEVTESYNPLRKGESVKEESQSIGQSPDSSEDVTIITNADNPHPRSNDGSDVDSRKALLGAPLTDPVLKQSSNSNDHGSVQPEVMP
ncbi:THUMP domain-containing protein 1 homolog [Tigriopus californicus]|uniref:THUMP domain-containing protein 1 homolog n=1 Tax=Tigriopus californicus TaxID=6832 RepID=UPI0027DAB395|nr:THUMP domain-containing protein 1 homolog [Tigriopus californicus]